MRSWSILVLFVGCGRAAPPLDPPTAGQSALELPTPVAVVELFTSEGCSSCPPADENLAELTAEAERSGRRVFTLERHVDYWDDLGWRDPFSDGGHSERQRQYAAHFGRSGIYTPQMIVNGREQFVGSERATARDAVARGLRTLPGLGVEVAAHMPADAPNSIRVEYRIGGTGPVDVQLALLEDRAETNVTQGENAHRRLRHRHVVRAFRITSATAPTSGEWLAAWPASASRANRTALVYVSDRDSLAVLGAGSAALTPETARIDRQFSRLASVEAAKIGSFSARLSAGASFVPTPQLTCAVTEHARPTSCVMLREGLVP